MAEARQDRPSTPGPKDRLRHAATITRSGVRRYPDELLASLRPARAIASPVPFDFRAANAPLCAAWLGHATVLLRIGDRWVLTDPVFSHRIGVRIGPITLGVGRLLPPFDPDLLPPIDLVLLSHAHFDHLDKPTLKRLVNRNTQVITATSTKRLIPRGFGDVRELAWDDTVDVGPFQIRAFRPAHWGARTALDRHRGFNSYIIDAPNAGRRVLYAGDTAYSPAFSQVGGVDLSIFGIGNYDPWIHAHASPEQVWEMHRLAGGRYLLPVHHSTFKLSDEPHGDPLRRLLLAAGDAEHAVVGRGLAEIWSHPDASPPATPTSG